MNEIEFPENVIEGLAKEFRHLFKFPRKPLGVLGFFTPHFSRQFARSVCDASFFLVRPATSLYGSSG